MHRRIYMYIKRDTSRIKLYISVLNFVANYGSSKAGFISQSVYEYFATVVSVNATAVIVPIKSPDGRQIRAFGHLSVQLARDLVPVWPHVCQTTYLPACLPASLVCLLAYLSTCLFACLPTRVVDRIKWCLNSGEPRFRSYFQFP